MRQHHRELLVYAHAVTGDFHGAEDVVQDAFVIAYRKFDEFDPERDFGAWMRGIVRNKCRDWFRSRARRPLTALENTEIEIDVSAWQEACARGQATVFDLLEKCLERLPETLREPVQSFYFKDRGGDAAAAELGISGVSLRKRLQRARALLHDCITNHLPSSTQPEHG